MIHYKQKAFCQFQNFSVSWKGDVSVAGLATWTMNQRLAVGTRSVWSPNCRCSRSSPCSPGQSVWTGRHGGPRVRDGRPCIRRRASLNPPSERSKSPPHTIGSCHLFPAASLPFPGRRKRPTEAAAPPAGRQRGVLPSRPPWTGSDALFALEQLLQMLFWWVIFQRENPGWV